MCVYMCLISSGNRRRWRRECVVYSLVLKLLFSLFCSQCNFGADFLSTLHPHFSVSLNRSSGFSRHTNKPPSPTHNTHTHANVYFSPPPLYLSHANRARNTQNNTPLNDQRSQQKTGAHRASIAPVAATISRRVCRLASIHCHHHRHHRHEHRTTELNRIVCHRTITIPTHNRPSHRHRRHHRRRRPPALPALARRRHRHRHRHHQAHRIRDRPRIGTERDPTPLIRTNRRRLEIVLVAVVVVLRAAMA